MPNIDNVVKQRLGIKWVNAKNLVEQATANLNLEGCDPSEHEEDIVQEAMEIFEDLPLDEQDKMRVKGETESDWKKKAREQAEKREREWQEEEERRKGQEENDRIAKEELGETEGVTKVKSVRVVEPTTRRSKQTVTSETLPPGVKVTTRSICCTIL